MSRVHVLKSPLTDYFWFELGWGYPGNIAAGEDIRILDVAEKVVSDLPGHDFWIFDDSRVYRMHYTDGGQFLGAAPQAHESLERYRNYRDTALFQASPRNPAVTMTAWSVCVENARREDRIDALGGSMMGRHEKPGDDGDGKTPLRERDGKFPRPLPPDPKDKDKGKEK
ncbi:DUF6879 family protein [Embleya sp. NPDC055664]